MRVRKTTLRLRQYNYSQPGYYFVTLCVKNRECIFGDVKNDVMILNIYGKIAYQYWMDIPNHYSNILLDKFVIMPNHIHGIIIIKPTTNRHMVEAGAEQCSAPTYGNVRKNNYGLLSKIIKSFKNMCTKQYRNNHNHIFQWQRSYHDHIIRNDLELQRIQQYIIDNPKKLK